MFGVLRFCKAFCITDENRKVPRRLARESFLADKLGRQNFDVCEGKHKPPAMKPGMGRAKRPRHKNMRTAEAEPLPALVVSATASRFRRAEALLTAHGFHVRHTPAVFVTGGTASSSSTERACRGFNGHRLAMRRAWQTIVAENRSMAIFEDDVMPAEGTDPLSLGRDVRRFVQRWSSLYDVLWLGGLARLGACNPASPFGLGCHPTHLPTPHGAGAGVAASLTFFTDHAKWFTPQGARAALTCSKPCLEHQGWSVDGIFKFGCTRSPTPKTLRTAPHLIELSQRFHDRYCGAALAGEQLRCKLPERSYWKRLVPTNGGKVRAGTSAAARSSQRVSGADVWVGFFWQDRAGVDSYLHNNQNSFSTHVTARARATSAGGEDKWLAIEVPVSEVGPLLQADDGWNGMQVSPAFIANWTAHVAAQRAASTGARTAKPRSEK